MNLAFCRRYGVPDKVASITIPLGAAFNMPGAAVTLSVYVSLALIGTGMGDWGTLAAAAMCSALFPWRQPASRTVRPFFCRRFSVSLGAVIQLQQ